MGLHSNPTLVTKPPLMVVTSPGSEMKTSNWLPLRAEVLIYAHSRFGVVMVAVTERPGFAGRGLQEVEGRICKVGKCFFYTKSDVVPFLPSAEMPERPVPEASRQLRRFITSPPLRQVVKERCGGRSTWQKTRCGFPSLFFCRSVEGSFLRRPAKFQAPPQSPCTCSPAAGM